MKRVLAVCAVVCASAGVAFGQCEFQPYGLPDAEARYSSPVNDQVVWYTTIRGDRHSCVCMTRNGGITWNHGSVDVAPAWFQITGISAVDAKTAWIAMYDESGMSSGTVFKTDDGGGSWEQQESAFRGSGGKIRDVHFFDSDVGICLGDPNDGYFEIYRTRDGGERWIRVAREKIPDPIASKEATTRAGALGERFSSSAYNGDSYWFATTLPSSGRVIVTTDRGATWSASSALPSKQPAIAFQNKMTGIASTVDGKLFRTTDGGQNWLTVGLPSWLLPGQRFPTYVPGTVSTYLLPSVALLGRDTAAVLTVSTDAGLTWKMMDRLDIPWSYQYDSDDLVGVRACTDAPCFPSRNAGWIGTRAGLIHWPGYAGKHLWKTSPLVRYSSFDAGINSSASTISIGNYGSEPVTVRHVTVSGGDFTIVRPPATPFTLDPWQAVDVMVTFTPKKRGNAADWLEIYSDAANGPELVVKLTGTTMKMAKVDVGKEMFAVGQSLFRVAAGGAATEVCSFGLGDFDALAVHPREKTLYGIKASASSSTLYFIDPKYPGALAAATIPVGDLRAIAFNNEGRLFGATRSGDLFRISHRTGSIMEQIGSAPGIVFASLAFSPSGELYASVSPPVAEKDAIYRISTSDGTATLVGRTGDKTATPSIAFSATGELYGLKGIGRQENSIIRIDPATAAGTPVGSTGKSGLRAIALIDILTTFESEEDPSLVKRAAVGVPDAFALHQNYPNPFNPSTSISFTLPEQTHAVLRVFDLLGQQIAVLADGPMEAGAHTVTYDASSLGSGVYFYLLTAGELTATRRMVLLR